jgi:hypothetical protein
MRFVIFSILGSALAASGCAGSAHESPAAHYAGEPFDLTARGDRISGEVCGMDLDLFVVALSWDEGATLGVELTGFIDGQIPVHLRQEAGDGLIKGSIGTSAGDAAVELRLTRERLVGRVGFRRFDLRARGDDFVGTMQIGDAIERSDVLVQDGKKLHALSMGEQVALLPTLLTCNVQPVGRWGKSSLTVRIGGPAGALPHQSSSVYTHDRS